MCTFADNQLSLKAQAAAEEELKKKRKMETAVKTAPEPKRFAGGPVGVTKPVASKLGKAPMTTSIPTTKVAAPFRPVVPTSNTAALSSSNSVSTMQTPQQQRSSTVTSTIRPIGGGLGPPMRASDINRPLNPNRTSQAQASSSASAQSVLQAQRQALQSHILAQNDEYAGQSEAIELPDIKSEYSDSDDEDRPKTEVASWAQSPDIRAAMKEQEAHNPDDIFGPMRPLSMEEVFRARAGKFRARSSSANWGGQDGVTPQEELEYAKRMGWK